MPNRASLVGSLLLLMALGQPLTAQEAYYMAVFAYDGPGDRARDAHTFATFAKARWCDGAWLVDSFTISWLPCNGVVHPGRVLPEAGHNFDLATTLRMAYAAGNRVSMWGPYQIQLELYQRALAQKARLESGAVTYKAVDTGWPDSRVSNCIHAVSDVAGQSPPLRLASPAWGDTASYLTTLHLLPWVINPCRLHDWVFQAWQLGCFPIRRYDLREGNPEVGPVRRVLMDATHRRLERRAQSMLSTCSACGP